MWFALLLVSWFVEIIVGVWFCYHFWMFTQVQYAGGAFLYGPGYAIVQGYNGFMSTWDRFYHPHPFVLTQEHIALFNVAIYLSLHLLALMRGLVAPYREVQARRPGAAEWKGNQAVRAGVCQPAAMAGCDTEYANHQTTLVVAGP